MVERINKALRDPHLLEGVLQRLRDEFGTEMFVMPYRALLLCRCLALLLCRRSMEQRIKQALQDSNLQDGVLQRLRDEFGADSQVASDNTIVLMFAGGQGTAWYTDHG
jgi:hypothetical protein